jgi:DNA-binding NarL/FixJ family response regulator
MPLLLDHLRNLFKSNDEEEMRVYSQDERLLLTLKNTAEQDGRPPEEVLDEMVKLHDERSSKLKIIEEQWEALSNREQEVTALICLGYNRNQIAKMLDIAPGTVKTHYESIFKKFDVHTSKHLERLLQGWDMLGWWEGHHHASRTPL